jgi:hypothetical protein
LFGLSVNTTGGFTADLHFLDQALQQTSKQNAKKQIAKIWEKLLFLCIRSIEKLIGNCLQIVCNFTEWVWLLY